VIGYMLDSNVLIDIARDPEGPVARRFESFEYGFVEVSVVVAGEARFGMFKQPHARSNPRMAYLLASLRNEHLTPDVADIYGRIRAQLESGGRSVSPNDYWIAAHAISRDAVLVTSDRRIHEAGIAGLRLEDWREAPPVQGQGQTWAR
jgi:tRNA(fMet)-specific endonuclease VapC